MKFVSYEEILIIHARILDATGGMHGVRDTHRIASAVERPRMRFGCKELYPTLFEKAAVYFESIAYHHPFIDGNKRTAIAVAARFLFLNGYDLATTDDSMEKFVLKAVVNKYEIQAVASWLQKHSKKRSEKTS